MAAAAAAFLSSTTTTLPSSSASSLSPPFSDHRFPPTSLSTIPKPLNSLSLKSLSPSLSSLPLLFSLPRATAGEFQDTAAEEWEPYPVQEEEEDGEEGEESEVEEIKGPDSVDDCRLYVGNLPYSMTSSQLAEVFGESGNVRSVEIIYDKVTDRSRGFGFVTMGSIEEAKEAIRMFDGSQVGGRTVKVNFPEVPRGGERQVMGPKIRSSYQSFVDSPHKIYAGNLGWTLTSQGLRDAFSSQPGFLSAKVIYERASGRSRGFGFVTFSSAEEAESALNAMNGVELEGRPLRLNMATQRNYAASSPSVGSDSEDVNQPEMASSISS